MVGVDVTVLVAPAKTPPEATQVLSELIGNAMNTPEVKTRLLTLGAQVTLADSARFAADIKAEFDSSSELAKRLGLVK